VQVLPAAESRMACSSEVQTNRPAGAQACDVSVIIPCYRCATTVQRAVASVAVQTVLPREVILVDDDSDDAGRTSAALEQIRAEHSGLFGVTLRRQAHNRGPGSARNLGWALATSQFVAFLDADDAWHPRKLELQAPWMIAHPSVVLTCHESEASRACSDTWEPQSGSPVGVRDLGIRDLMLSNLVSTRTVMIQRVCRERFAEGSRFSEDFDLWLRIVGGGGKCTMIRACLARSYKGSLECSGQSGHVWAMESGELHALSGVLRRRQLPMAWVRLAQAYSLLKFLHRVVISGLLRVCGKSTSPPS
jgi:glycosyltransferase involved in cell wall biosynthesis